MITDHLDLFLTASLYFLNLRGLNVGPLLALRDGMACSSPLLRGVKQCCSFFGCFALGYTFLKQDLSLYPDWP